MNKVVVIGSFDNIHSHHVRFLQEASRLGSLRVLLWSDDAITAHEEMVRLFPPFISHLGHTYARAGRTEDALRIVEELEAQPPSTWNANGLALIHAALGNREESLRWLEFEPAHAWLAWVTTSWYRDFDDYRDDPRFQTLLGGMHLRFGPGDRWPTPLPVAHPELPGARGEASPDSSGIQ